MNIKKEKATLPLPVISDGRLIKESLKALEIEEKDIKTILKANKTEVSKVFLMSMDRYKNSTLIKMRNEQ